MMGVGVAVLALIYCGSFILNGWIPMDEGLLGQMGQRVLEGQLPHLDFDEIYSGGLSALNALSFLVWGEKLSSLRITLLIFHTLFSLSVYTIASRFAKPWLAALTTLLCISWGLANYPAGMPSWYNLFFAGFGTYFLMKHIETRHKTWVFLAGLMAGFSFWIKITGIYFFLTGLAFLVFRESEISKRWSSSHRGFFWLKLPFILALVGFLVRLMGQRLDLGEAFHFILPGFSVACYLAWQEFHGPHPPFGERIKSLWRLLWPYFSGFLTPCCFVLTLYLKRHGLNALFEGLFLRLGTRYDFSFYPLPSLWTAVFALPLGGLLWASVHSKFKVRFKANLYVGCVILVSLILATIVCLGSVPEIYNGIWDSVRPLAPICVILGLLALARRQDKPGTKKLTSEQKQRVFLLMAGAAFIPMVQFPFSFGTYFCYGSAFIILSGLAIVQTFSFRLKELLAIFSLGYLGFALVWLNRGDVWTTGAVYKAAANEEWVLPKRANLLVSATDRAVYETLVELIQKHTSKDSYIYAAPDCPEVYYLSGKKNPTPVLLDYVVPEHVTPTNILETLRSHSVHLVVFNSRLELSQKIDSTVYAEVARSFHHMQDVGWFRVFYN